MANIETHPLKPFLPANAKILMLGSFPPPKARWTMDFFYPNFLNDMWRIFGIVFFKDKNYFLQKLSSPKFSVGDLPLKSFDKDKISSFLNKKGIALYDTAVKVKRLSGNASDKFLEIVEPVDFKKLLSNIPKCEAVVLTGEKAADTLQSIIGFEKPKVGHCEEWSDAAIQGRSLKIYRMPSSSRAYPKPVEEKAKVYAAMFKELGI